MVSAIVLAAGLSARMGSYNKLLLPYNNSTIINTVVENILAANMHEVIVVTGYQHDKIEAALRRLSVKLVHNHSFVSGMTSSIKTGMDVALGQGYMICLSDMPALQPADYRWLCKNYSDVHQLNPACICLPKYMGQKCNPVIFSSWYREAILQNKNPEGCKNIIEQYGHNLAFTEVATSAIFKDVDTIKDYEEMANSIS